MFHKNNRRLLWALSGHAAAQQSKRGLRAASCHSRNTENSTLLTVWPDVRAFGCSERSLDYGARYDRTEPKADAAFAVAKCPLASPVPDNRGAPSGSFSYTSVSEVGHDLIW